MSDSRNDQDVSMLSHDATSSSALAAPHVSDHTAQQLAPVATSMQSSASNSATNEATAASPPVAAAPAAAATAVEASHQPAPSFSDAPVVPDSKTRVSTTRSAPSLNTATSSSSSSSTTTVPSSAAAAALRIVLAGSARRTSTTNLNATTSNLATEVLPAPPKLPSDPSYAPLAPDVRPEGGLLSLQPGITAQTQAANRKKAQLAQPVMMLSVNEDGSRREGQRMPDALRDVILGRPVGGEKAAAARAAVAGGKKSSEPKQPPTTARKGRHSAPTRPSALVLSAATPHTSSSPSSSSLSHDAPYTAPLSHAQAHSAYSEAVSAPSTAVPSPNVPHLALLLSHEEEEAQRTPSRALSEGGPPELDGSDAGASASFRSESTVPLEVGAADGEGGMGWSEEMGLNEGVGRELQDQQSGEKWSGGEMEDVEMRDEDGVQPSSSISAAADGEVAQPQQLPQLQQQQQQQATDDAVMSEASGLVVASSGESDVQPQAQAVAAGAGATTNGNGDVAMGERSSAGTSTDALTHDASASTSLAPTLASTAATGAAGAGAVEATSTDLVPPPAKRGRGRPKKLLAAPLSSLNSSTALTTSTPLDSPSMSLSPLPLASPSPGVAQTAPLTDTRGRPRRSAAPTASMDLKQRRKPRASPGLFSSPSGAGRVGAEQTPTREREPQAELNVHLTPNTRLMIPTSDTASAEAVNEARAFANASPSKKGKGAVGKMEVDAVEKEVKTTPVGTGKSTRLATPLGAPASSAVEEEQSTLVTKSGGAAEKVDAVVNNEHCETCFGSGHLLCCEGCVRSFHFQCLNPPLDIDEMPAPQDSLPTSTSSTSITATSGSTLASAAAGASSGVAAGAGAAKVEEPAWFCRVCKASKNKKRKAPKTLFGPLLHQLEAENPTNYALPAEIRNYFKGVATAQNGDYINASVLRPLKVNKAGFLDERDPFKLKDKNGKAALCYSCGESALPAAPSSAALALLTTTPSSDASLNGKARLLSPTYTHDKEEEGWRKIVSCDYCSLHWHIDCLNPPLIGMPHATRKWMCPNHVEHVQKPQRVPKSGQAAPQSIDLPLPSSATVGRGKHYRSRVRNDGHIDIIPDPLDTLFDADSGAGKSLAKGWEEQDVPGSAVASKLRYRIPEKVIRLDFWQRVRSEENNARLQMELPSSSSSGLDMLASIASHRLGTTHVTPARQLIKTVLMPEPTPPADEPLPLSSLRTSVKRRANSSSSSDSSSSLARNTDGTSPFAPGTSVEVRVTKPLAKRNKMAPSIATTTDDGAMEQDDSGNESPLTDIDEDAGESNAKGTTNAQQQQQQGGGGGASGEIGEAEAMRLRAVKQLMERAGEERLLRFLESASLDD